MRGDVRLESIHTLLRIHRESKEEVKKFYNKFNWYSAHPHRSNDLKMLKYCQECIALFKRRMFTAEREIIRRDFNKNHSFEKLGF
jgi:hypothetical protein